MIYAEIDPCYEEGQHQFFRVYADTAIELRGLITAAKLDVKVYEKDQANEHIILTARALKKLKATVAIDERGKVKLFMQKTRAIAGADTPPGHTDLLAAPETIDDFMAANPLDPEGGHASDCALHNGPALPTGECDCGALKKSEPFPAPEPHNPRHPKTGRIQFIGKAAQSYNAENAPEASNSPAEDDEA